MYRIQAYVEDSISEALKLYAKKNNCSVSHLVGNIITRYLSGEVLDQEEREHNKELLIRSYNVLSQIFHCVYDPDKVSIPSDSSKDCLSKIKSAVKHSLQSAVGD